jgi:hypothetical protein
MLLDNCQCEAPVTACAVPDEELTPPEDCKPLDELELVDEDGDVVAEDEEPVVVPLVTDDPADPADAVPGIVAALTALKTPTDATAAMPAPRVRRSSSLRPASLARMRCSVGFVLSMGYSLEGATEPNVGECCEVPERAESGGG